MSKTTDYLTILKKLDFGSFKFESEDKYEKSKQIWKLLDNYESTYDDLGITDPDEKSKLFKLLERNLKEPAEDGTSDNNAAVKTAKNSWDRLKAKLKYFYDLDKLTSQARAKLKNVRQNDKSAKQLLVDILELWKLAEYTADEEQVLTTLLLALRDPEVKIQYELSLLPGNTKWTLETIVQYADTFAANKPKNSNSDFSVKKTTYRGRGRGRSGGRGNRGSFRGSFSYNNQSSRQKCKGCGSWRHSNKDPKLCPSIGQKCNSCGGRDHFARMCTLNQSSNRGQFSRGAPRGSDRGWQRSYRGNYNKKVEADEERESQDQKDKQEQIVREVLVSLAAGCKLGN